MATHSSILAWKISWMEKSGRLQFMGSQRVEHVLSDFTFTFPDILIIIYFKSYGNLNQPIYCDKNSFATNIEIAFDINIL